MDDTDSTSLMIMYKDYTFLMHVACQSAASFYFYIKVVLNLLNLIMSSAMSAMELSYMNTASLQQYNNTVFDNLLIIVKSGSVINLVICMISGTLYYFKIAERELFFKIQADNYLKLNNIIILELSVHKSIEETFIRFVIQEFTFLVENMTFKLPTFIKKGIKNTYKNYNIPPYLDSYIHNFSIMSKIFQMKKTWFIKNSSNMDLEKNVITSLSSSPKFCNINKINYAYAYDNDNDNLLIRENSSYFSSNNNLYVYSIPLENQIIQM